MARAGADNVFIAAGHSRNGILLTPIAGDLMAGVNQGKPPLIAPNPFRPDRPALQKPGGTGQSAAVFSPPAPFSPGQTYNMVNGPWHVAGWGNREKEETVNAFLQVGGLAVVPLLTVGPVLGLLLLLNRRDRHHAALHGLVWEMAPKNLAGLIAIHVRCALFSSRSEVTVEMQACSRDEIWEAISRWSPRLPPRTRLLVKGALDGGGTAHIGLEASRRPSASSPSRGFLVPS